MAAAGDLRGDPAQRGKAPLDSQPHQPQQGQREQQWFQYIEYELAEQCIAYPIVMSNLDAMFPVPGMQGENPPFPAVESFVPVPVFDAAREGT